MSRKLACIILAAGKGTRMKSDLPKPLHPVAGLPMISHIINTCETLSPEKIVVVISPDSPALKDAVRDHDVAIQSVANGTGGAALAARKNLEGFNGDILVVFGDTPLIKPETLQNMITVRHAAPEAGLVFSAFTPENPTGYGRMVLDDDQTLLKIIEHKDTDDHQRKIKLCNGGAMLADGKRFFKWLDQVGNDNAQGEYYLVDLPEIARRENIITRIAEISEDETRGVNSRHDLAKVEKTLQKRLRHLAMENGVTLIDPKTVYLSMDTKFGRDIVIEPNVFIGPNVTIDDGVTIHAFSHITGTHIGKHAVIGPFARLRPGTDIGENAKIGNFVEVKKTVIGKGSKAGHLSYLGDATIGQNVNIGAGTITCNYDGYDKFETEIHDGAFIGSNTALVAPILVGRDSMVAAGSTITNDVSPDALALARSKQTEIKSWSKDFRKIKEHK